MFYLNFTILVLTGLLLMPSLVRAEERHLSLPSYEVNSGDLIEVPLTLDQATGLAAIRVQVNFNPDVLTLEAVTAGALGQSFEMVRGDDDGLVQITFARATEMVNGSGQLALLRFRANSGAAVDLTSELAIADFSLSDATGVIDLRQKDTLTLTNGQVVVSASQAIDNARNGLPDWWEELHGLNLFSANALLDPENDGLPNLLEYAFGLNPSMVDAHQRGIQSSSVDQAGTLFQSIGFYRRKAGGVLYKVQESGDLSTWYDLSISGRMRGTPQDMLDGTEYIEVLGSRAITGPAAEVKGFMRVVVESP